MIKNFKTYDKQKIQYTGLIENTKNSIKPLLFKYLRNKNSFSISLFGIGTNYANNKNINGIYEIKLMGNYFIDDKKYSVKITSNRYIELIID